MRVDNIEHTSCCYYRKNYSNIEDYYIKKLTEIINHGVVSRFKDELPKALFAGVSIDVSIDRYSRTMLSYSLKSMRYDIAQYLLEAGADLRPVDDNKDTALMTLLKYYKGENLSASERETFMVISAHLIMHEEDINKVNSEKKTVPMLAVSASPSLGEDILINLLTLMEAKGVDMRMRDDEGDTLMSKSIICTKGTRVLEKIIDMGASVNDFAIVGDKINVVGYSGWRGYHYYSYTPIHVAIVRNDPDKLRLLIERGARKDELSTWDVCFAAGRTEISPRSLAEKWGNEEIIHILKENNFDWKFEDTRWCDSDNEGHSVHLSDIDDFD